MVAPVAAAVVCLAGIGWTIYADLARASVPALASAGASKAGSLGAARDSLTLVAPSPAAPAAAPVAAYAAPQQPYRRGTFIPPVGGWVTQLFGPTTFTLEPPFTYNGVTYAHFHTGIDIDAPLDTVVVASAAGVVLEAGSEMNGQTLVGYGNFVVIQHQRGYLTLYGHLDRILVTAGQRVSQLQPVGLIGTTGLSTGPHLHFEIRRYGELLDPLPYLLGRIRPW